MRPVTPADQRALLARTLAPIADALSNTSEPWWLVGSAAIVSHGTHTSVGDVDILCTDGADARGLIARLGGDELIGTGNCLFRSTVFGRCEGLLLPIEVMAGFAVRGEPIQLVTREWRWCGDVEVPVPSRAELIALLRRFGRAKDLARAALLES